MASKQAGQSKQAAKDAPGSSKAMLPALPKLPAGADVDTDSQADQQEEAPPQFGLMSKLQSVLDAADDDEEGDTGFEDLQVSNACCCLLVLAPPLLVTLLKSILDCGKGLLQAICSAGCPATGDQEQGSQTAAEATSHPAGAASILRQPGDHSKQSYHVCRVCISSFYLYASESHQFNVTFHGCASLVDGDSNAASGVHTGVC